MWHWDQGHLSYFQFDALRRIASFVTQHDFHAATRAELAIETGLTFAGPKTHSPRRQYSRTLKLCLLASEAKVAGHSVAVQTEVAELLSRPGAITPDEYFKFLARAFTEPSPALKNWEPNAEVRYPLLFALKYMLAKRAVSPDPVSTLDEIIGAYIETGLVGDEDYRAFMGAVGGENKYGDTGRQAPKDLRRQARESLKVISQISYLHLEGANLSVSLVVKEAQEAFEDLTPVLGPRAHDSDSEIRRLAALCGDSATEDFFDYQNTVANDVVLSGFTEGGRVKQTHITIERNSGLRQAYFTANPTPICDVCNLDTATTYPWATRILDIHHLLPLASGTRVVSVGAGKGQARTTFEDLVPICPSCHRAVHRFYDIWLVDRGLNDFPNEELARDAYRTMKAQFKGAVHA